MTGAAALLLVLAGAAAFGQQGPPFHGEAFVNTVEVPVRVTDSAGRPRAGLEVRDFEILEDGVLQVITNFEEIGFVPLVETEAESGVQTYQFGARASLDVVYFFDLLLGEKPDKERAVDGLRQLYCSSPPVGERVSIVIFDGELRPVLERSTSSTEILGALSVVDAARAQGRLWGMHFTNPDDLVSGMPDQRSRQQMRRAISRPMRRQYFEELRARVAKVGAGVSATMARYAVGDVRRALVVFTPGLPRSTWSGLDGSWDAQVDEPSYLRRGLWYATAMEAADLGFTLYFVDSSTARYLAETDVDRSPAPGSGLASGTGSDGQDPGAEADANSGLGFDSTRRDLLAEAAYITGGEALHASDVDRALQDVSDELGHYYSLAYQPEHVGDGREHSITVRLPNHSALRVDHRRSYVDRSLAARERQQLRAQMLFGTGSNIHGITVEVGEPSKKFRIGARGMKQVKVAVCVRVPFSSVALISDGPDYAVVARFAFMVEDAAGNASPVVNHQMMVTVARDEVEEALTEGNFTFITELETEGGRQTLHVAVTDAVTERTSVLSLDLDF